MSNTEIVISSWMEYNTCKKHYNDGQIILDTGKYENIEITPDLRIRIINNMKMIKVEMEKYEKTIQTKTINTSIRQRSLKYYYYKSYRVLNLICKSPQILGVIQDNYNIMIYALLEIVRKEIINNEEMYRNIFISNDKVLPYYELKDEFYVKDFIEKYNNKQYYSAGYEIDEEDKEMMIRDLSRCCRTIITAGGPTYVFKESRDKPFKILDKTRYKGKDWLFCNNYTIFEGDANKEDDLLDPTKYKDKISKFEIFHYINDSKLWSQQIICEPHWNDEIPMANPRYFNKFPGYIANYVGKVSFDSEKSEELERYNKILPILEHIRLVLADEDEILNKYITSLIAYPIQKQERSDVCFCNLGEQGIGKSILFEKFIYPFIYGSALSHTFSTLEGILGKFNSILEGKLSITIDEASTDHYHKDFDKMKAMITGETISIEPKGKEMYQTPNYANVIINSNNDHCLKLEKKDRRYFVLKPSNRYINDPKYFENLAKCFTQECGDIFFSYCRDYPLVPLRPIPITDIKQDLIDSSSPKHEIFFKQLFIESNTVISNEIIFFNSINNKYYFIRKKLYQQFIEWCRESGIKSPCTEQTFLVDLRKSPLFHNIENKESKRKFGNKSEICSYLDPKYYSTTIIIDETLLGRKYSLTESLEKFRQNHPHGIKDSPIKNK